MPHQRDHYIDIVKSIGIISIVIGHSSWTITPHNIQIGPFVYTYHLMIFMFISGYLFNTEKASQDTNYKYVSLGKQTIKFAKMFLLYGTIFVLSHNYLLSIHCINGAQYSLSEIISNSFNHFTFGSSEVLLGAFWFIPTLLIARALFIVSYNEKNINNWSRLITIILCFAILGLTLCTKKIGLNYRMSVSILSVPFLYLGTLTKKKWAKIEKYITSWSWILSAIIITFIIKFTKQSIDLSVLNIINPFIFYPISIIGIYFCLSFAKMIYKWNYIKTVFAIIGENSFHIMALHFLVIKLIDVFYSEINGINNVELISHFPYSYSENLFWIYYLCGVFIPTILIIIIKKLVCLLRQKN